MLKYYRLYKLISERPYLLVPNISTEHVSTINYTFLKSKGIQYIVYDRDNTISGHLSESFFSKKEEEVIQKVKEMFGENCVALLSNSLIKKSNLL